MTITKNQLTALLILFAFVFSFAVRLIWVDQFNGVDQFKFNGEFMINTNDGYFYAEGARDILAGKTESTNDLSPFERAGSILTAWMAKILPLSFETVIFYMPAFFASLIVIPLILITREFEKLEVGFIAALLGSIAWSYYNRTMVGYYDTDLLNIVFPTILLWSLIWSLKDQDEKYFLIAGLDSIAYRWWYPKSYSLEFAFIAFIFVYVMYQYFKKEKFQTNLLLISFMIFAMINVDGWIRLAMVLLLFGLIKFQREFIIKYIYYVFGIAVVLFFVTGGFDPIWGQLKGYVFRDSVSQGANGLGLNFFTVMQTVREAGSIPFEMFANRISGHTFTLLVSLVGYIWFAYRYPVMLLALPMLGLGFLAYGIPGLIGGGGLRFTVYAVPVMALGFGFLVVEVSKFLASQLADKRVSFYAQYIFMVLFTVLGLYPNIKHVQEYKVPTVFTKDEVVVLDKFKSIADREDYVVTWWDYGYPIRYYSDVKTLIDGGKHSGAVNFPISYILNSDQISAAKMARLDVEYTEKRFAVNESNKGLDKNHKDYVQWAGSNIEQMTLDYGFDDTNTFLKTLKGDLELPSKTRDVYLYLPNRMMQIFPTVALFSNLDLMTGEKKKAPLFYMSKNFREQGNEIELGRGVKLLKNKGAVAFGNQAAAINNFVVVEYDNQGKLHKNIQTVNPSGQVNVIFMKSYRQFLVLDQSMYNSSYIQMFVLEQYDPKLYEPVILHPLSKIYKLKI